MFTHSVASLMAVGDVDGGVQVATVLSEPCFERLALVGAVHSGCELYLATVSARM